MSGCLRKSSTSSIILWRSVARLSGGVVNTLFLRYRQRKKSHGVRSGERGGHSMSCCNPITRFGNVAFSRSLTAMRRCAGPHFHQRSTDQQLHHCHSPTQTVSFARESFRSKLNSGGSPFGAYLRILCVFTSPFIMNPASSPTTTFAVK